MAGKANPIRLRLVSISEYQFLRCMQAKLWGSKSGRFGEWRKGDYLAFAVNKFLAGLAIVSAAPFVSRERVWDNDIFPHRIPVRFIHTTLPAERLPILGEVRDALTSVWGPKYGWGMLNQQLLEGTAAETILRSIQSRPNDLETALDNLAELSDQAREQQRKAKEPQKVSKRRAKQSPPSEATADEPGSLDEESTHSRAQSALIRLGKATG